ncbi:MAG: tetratricopeptide repeat protein, partial [Chloroflexi bacterium]|nr:tetratricopeptide repeat protein [Chloroflexota bacterium]
AAYRDIEVHRQHPLSALLADLAHAGLVAHLALGPLSPTEASALLDYLLEGVEGAGPELRERLLRRADGVPFFVTSCAQGIRLGASDAASLDALPWDVSQSVRQRAATLPPVAQDVLGLTAVVGRRAGSELLLAVAGHEAAAVLEALEAACRARLLEEDGDGAYHFTHDVIREVVEADLSAARRTMLHRRVGEELERRQAPVETLAFHFSRSGDPARAALYLERAGDSARAQHAIATAEGYYRELVDRLDGRGHLAEAAAAREKLGTTLTTTGRYGEALAVLREAARTYGDLDDLEGEGRAVARIGRVQYLAGAPEEGIALLEPLRDRLSQSACGGEAPSQALAALNVALAPLYLARSRYRDQLEAARTAAALARRLGDDRLLAEAEVWRGCALNQLGSLEEGRRVQEAAIPLAEAVDDLASLSHALNDMGFLYEVEGRFARSRGYKERALQVAERMGDPAGIANMAFRCGQNAFLAGDWTRARQYFERAVDSAGQLGSSTISAYPLFGLGLLATARGDFKAARQHLAACRAVADRTEDAQVLRAVQGVLAEQELLEGRPQAAHDRLRSLDPSEEGLGLHSLLPVLAETCLAAGERDAARGHLATSLDRATARRDNLLLVDTLRVQALLALREERWSDADQTLDEGLRLARGMPHPYAEGRLLHLRSLLDIRRGAPERARGHLGAALQIFQRLGARRHAEDALRALEGLDAGA